MLKLDNDLLTELGLGSLPEDQKQGMLQHIYDTLELRVGTRLANQMTDQQLDEFERFIDVNGDANQAQALQWLETNLPHYKDVVNQVFEELKAEIKQMAPQIMAASVPPGGAPAAIAADPAAGPAAGTQAAQPPMQQDGSVAAVQTQPQMAAPVQPYPPQTATSPAPSPVDQPYQATPQPPAPPTPAPVPAQPAQGRGQDAGAQLYQFPAQQPPAGPGSQDQQAA